MSDRRDEIDSSHYPAFHQMEGVKILPECEGLEKEKWYSLSLSLSLTQTHTHTSNGGFQDPARV